MGKERIVCESHKKELMAINRTRIEWTDFSLNYITGCPRRCVFDNRGKCYAWNLANGRLKQRYLANPNVAPGCDPNDPFSPRFWPRRLNEPRRLKKPAKIFAVDMGDMFAPCIPRAWQDAGFSMERECPQHTFQHLTKFPENLAQHNPWPDNTWVGATAINNEMAIRAVEGLLKTDACANFISFEPLLGPISVDLSHINWIIIGAQTNPKRQPSPEWVQALLDEADRWNVPVFMKDNLAWPSRRREWPKQGGE